MRRLKIGIDIDGVLADIVRTMLPLLARECGRAVKHDDIICYSFSEALNIPEERVAALMEEVIAEGHFGAAPVIDGAVEALELLYHHTLWLVTSRPECVRNETVRWLAQHRVPYHELVFAPATGKARNGDGFDLFVEDNLETALVLSGEDIPVLLFDWPWNQHPALPPNVQRVRNWQEILSVVQRQACA